MYAGPRRNREPALALTDTGRRSELFDRWHEAGEARPEVAAADLLAVANGILPRADGSAPGSPPRAGSSSAWCSSTCADRHAVSSAAAR
jgi:hypothetical protein